MATTVTKFYRGAAATTSTALTATVVPGSTTWVVTNIVVSNTSTATQTATISMGGIVVVPTVSVPANGIATFDIKQVMVAADTGIYGYASSTSVNFHISGVTIV
jgi:hypothetical protein